MDYTFSDKISSLQPSAIREILKATADPKIIPLAKRQSGTGCFPVEEVRAIAADILDSALLMHFSTAYPRAISRCVIQLKSG